MGMELVQRPGFFYVRMLSQSKADEDSRDQESSTSVRQIQGVLLVLGRGVLEKGYMFEAMTLSEAGISRETLESIDSDPTMLRFSRPANMNSPCQKPQRSPWWTETLPSLTTRAISCWPTPARHSSMTCFAKS